MTQYRMVVSFEFTAQDDTLAHKQAALFTKQLPPKARLEAVGRSPELFRHLVYIEPRLRRQLLDSISKRQKA